MSSIGARIGGNLGWLAASVAAERFLFFLATLYLARALGAQAFGRLAAAQVTVLGIWLVVDLGVSGYGVKEIARDRRRAVPLVNALFGARLLSASIGLGAWVVGLRASGPLGLESQTLLACGLYLVANALSCDWVLRGFERFRSLVAGSAASATFFLAGCLVLVRGPGDLRAAALLWSGAALLSALVLLRVLRREGPALRPVFAPSAWMPHLRESLYFSLAAGVMSVHALLPVWLLDRGGVTAIALGLFAAPYRLIGAVGRAGILVQSAFFPALAESYAGDPAGFTALFRRHAVLMAGLGLVVAGAGSALAEPLVGLLLGREYAASVPVFRLLLCTMGVRLLRIAYDGALMAIGFHRLKTLLSVAGVASLLLCFRLLPVADPAIGMATAVLLSEVVLLGALALGAGLAAPRRREEPA